MTNFNNVQMYCYLSPHLFFFFSPHSLLPNTCGFVMICTRIFLPTQSALVFLNTANISIKRVIWLLTATLVMNTWNLTSRSQTNFIMHATPSTQYRILWFKQHCKHLPIKRIPSLISSRMQDFKCIKRLLQTARLFWFITKINTDLGEYVFNMWYLHNRQEAERPQYDSFYSAALC